MERKYKEIHKKARKEKTSEAINSQGVSYFVASTLTAPFRVLGVTLQLSVRANKGFYGEETKAIARLELAKSYGLAVQERQFNALQLASGMIGENKPFRAPIYNNYREVFLGLAGQGYKGFFKGNGADLMHYLSSLTMKLGLVKLLSTDSLDLGFSKWLLGLGIATLADVACQPLHNFQTRLILQNRIYEFNTYRSIFTFVNKMSFREAFQGWSLVMPMNFGLSISAILASSGASVENQLVCALLGYSVCYPLNTVQRRLEAQSSDHTMLPRRYKGVRYALSKIYHEEGLVGGLYRGYFCNSLATLARYALVIPLASAMLEGLDYWRYKKEGWDL